MLAIRARIPSACLQAVASKLSRGAQTAAAISRSDEYATISDRDIAYFQSVLGDRGIVTDPDALQPLNKSACVCLTTCSRDCHHSQTVSNIAIAGTGWASTKAKAVWL